MIKDIVDEQLKKTPDPSTPVGNMLYRYSFKQVKPLHHCPSPKHHPPPNPLLLGSERVYTEEVTKLYDPRE